VRIDAVRILLVVAVAAPLLAVWTGQDAAATDWPKEVERACTSPRYGLRLAASRKVAKAGAPAIDAIRAFATKNGVNQVPAALVDAIADDGTDEPAVLQLLTEWSADRDFYWRASALRGLALRAPRLDGAARAPLAERFAALHGDPAWLMRTHARFGTVLCGDDAPLGQPEADPRARARLAVLLLQQGKVPPLQPLLDALADERTFQGDPWGARLGTEAHKALKTWLGDAHPLPEGGEPDKAAAIAALRDACAKKSGQTLVAPPVRQDAARFPGGIELLSCKHGDQFVQWTGGGTVHFGIDAATAVTLPAERWQALEREREALRLSPAVGTIVCDHLRLRWDEPEVHAKVAPGSLPAPAVRWLEQLADAVAAAGNDRDAAALRSALGQFAAR
jgi:hypothetical protein